MRITSGDSQTILECTSFGERDALVQQINALKDDGGAGTSGGSGGAKIGGPNAAAKQALLDNDRWPALLGLTSVHVMRCSVIRCSTAVCLAARCELLQRSRSCSTGMLACAARRSAARRSGCRHKS